MKKLLVLVLVLSMVASANAALQLSVNGDKQATAATLSPSGTLILDVWTNAAIANLAGFNTLLVCTTGGSIDYLSGVVIAADSGMTFYRGGNAHAYLGSSAGLLPANEEGMGLNAFDIDPEVDEDGDPVENPTPTNANDTLFDQIVFHCDAPGDVTIKLYTLNATLTTITLRDSVAVHQTPEPMTLGLLGLGGLFLRRRK